MLIKIKYGRYNNRHVITHETDSEVPVYRWGKIIQRIFLLNQEPAFAEPLGNDLERLAFPGALTTFIKNFCCYNFCPVYFVSPQLTAPGSMRMVPLRSTDTAYQKTKEIKLFQEYCSTMFCSQHWRGVVTQEL